MQKKASLQEQVYFSIKNSIIQGEFVPGEKLTEMKLVEKLNASRTPIREALRKLEQEGFINYLPSQGVQVTTLSKSAMKSLYECRSVLEGLATRKAAEFITEAQLTVLEESIFLGRQYFATGNLIKVVEKNTVFHDTILQASVNPLVQQMMDQIHTQILRYRVVTSKVGFRSTFLDEHEEILRALANRDSQTAESLMREHIMRDLATILAGLEKEKLEASFTGE